MDGDAVQLAVEVPQGHIHGGLGAGIVDDALLNGLAEGLKFVHFLAHDVGSDVVPDGTDDGTGGVAGDDTGGRCFAIAHSAGIGVDLHDHILNGVDGAQGGFERGPQGHGDPAQTYFGNLHREFSFGSYLASSYIAAAMIWAFFTRLSMVMYSSALCSRISSPGKMGPQARMLGMALA